MSGALDVPAILRVPPPLLFVAAFLAGVGLQRLLPLPPASAPLSSAMHGLGAFLTGAGLALALSSVVIFLYRRTTLIPFGTAATLVIRGPYRFTRNPMYLGLVLVYLGVAGIASMPWPLLLLPLPVAIVNARVIPFEEARLRARFGAEFERYCARVRRWL